MSRSSVFILHPYNIVNRHGYLCSMQYIDVGRHSDAIAAFKTAIELQRAHSNAWNNLGKLYENLGRNMAMNN